MALTKPYRYALAAVVIVLLPIMPTSSTLFDALTSSTLAHHEPGHERSGSGGDSGAGTGGATPQPYDDAVCETAPVAWTNDPCAGRQWGLVNIKAPEAWDSATGAGVTIAVVDTGVDFDHPDLAQNLVMVRGSDMIKNTQYVCPFQELPEQPANSRSTAVAQDDNGHGTHVAGIIAAVTGNGEGVAGVAPNAKILPVKVLDADGLGTSDDVARGICFAVDHGADVINISLGVDPANSIVIEHSDLLDGGEVHQAIQYAVDNHVAVIAAAGNESFPICDYPAALPGVLCVGAVDQFDQKAWYSNFGSESSTTPTAINHVVAPGGAGAHSVACESDLDIWSTVLPGVFDCSDNGYDTLSGTSQAAPYVAGVAALVAQQFRAQATPAFVYDKLRVTADDLGVPGVDAVYGHGRVNALRAVSE